MPTGEDIQAFELTTKRGHAMGFLHKDQIVIHHIMGQKAMKGIMEILCNKFNTRKFRFTMITNPNLKNIIRGKVSVAPAEEAGNPFEEPVENIEGVWESCI